MARKKLLTPTEAAKKGVDCPCGICHRPSVPLTPNDLPNFGHGREGMHLEGRIAATAVALAGTEEAFDESQRYLSAEIERAENAEDIVKELRKEIRRLKAKLPKGKK
jgi:hypothetical protein